MLNGLVLQLLTFHCLSLKTTHGGMRCISDTKSRSAVSVTRVLIPETPGVFMLLVSVAWCSHVVLIKFLSMATSLVIINCDNVNYCQWQHHSLNVFKMCHMYLHIDVFTYTCTFSFALHTKIRTLFELYQ